MIEYYRIKRKLLFFSLFFFFYSFIISSMRNLGVSFFEVLCNMFVKKRKRPFYIFGLDILIIIIIFSVEHKLLFFPLFFLLSKLQHKNSKNDDNKRVFRILLLIFISVQGNEPLNADNNVR